MARKAISHINLYTIRERLLIHLSNMWKTFTDLRTCWLNYLSHASSTSHATVNLADLLHQIMFDHINHTVCTQYLSIFRDARWDDGVCATFGLSTSVLPKLTYVISSVIRIILSWLPRFFIWSSEDTAHFGDPLTLAPPAGWYFIFDN